MNWTVLSKTKKDPPFETFMFVWRITKDGGGYPRLASLEEIKSTPQGKEYTFRDSNSEHTYSDVTHFCIPEPPK